MDKAYQAIVEKIVVGRHGLYVVAKSTELGSVTFSLEPSVWLEQEKPELGTYVVLSQLRRKRAGWRAAQARFVTPSDQPATSKEQGEMSSNRKEVVLEQIGNLVLNLFVRKELNPDRVIFLAEMIQNGEKLHPIKINRQRMVIDGRHRIEAHDLNNLKEIECTILDINDEAEIISEAFKSNLGGALPPTPEDTEHAVELLLKRGESKKRIAELLALPIGMAKKFVTDVQSRMNRVKKQQAAAAVTEGGLTMQQAATKYDIDIEQLRDFMSGFKKKNKQGIDALQRTLTVLYKSLGQKNAASLRRTIEKFEDGDVTEKQVREIFVHLEQLQKKSARAVADWKRRFEASVVEAKARQQKTA